MATEAVPSMVDELDLQLIRELETDPRKINSDLASELGVSPSVVSRRLQKLINKRLLRIVALTTPAAIGYGVRAAIAINVHPYAGDVVADQLAEIPSMRVVLVTTGRYDIFAWAICRDTDDFLNLLTAKLNTIPGIQRANIMMGVKHVKIDYGSAVSHNHTPIRPSLPSVLDAVDLALIKELEADGRLNTTNLAQKVGASWLVVQNKVQRLVQENIIGFMAMPNMPALGYEIPAVVLFQTDLAEIRTVAKRLAEFSEVKNVMIVAGNYQILIWVLFRDTQHMSGFLRNEIRLTPGILTYETLVGLRLAKFSTKLLTHLGYSRESRASSTVKVINDVS